MTARIVSKDELAGLVLQDMVGRREFEGRLAACPVLIEERLGPAPHWRLSLKGWPHDLVSVGREMQAALGERLDISLLPYGASASETF